MDGVSVAVGVAVQVAVAVGKGVTVGKKSVTVGGGVAVGAGGPPHPAKTRPIMLTSKNTKPVLRFIPTTWSMTTVH